jgi:predicted alpha/beta-hydrolase family hydrolase
MTEIEEDRVEVTRVKFVATEKKGEVTGLWICPESASHVLVLSHAAGTSIEHASMVSIASALNDVGIATFRYNFPYMEKGGGGLDGRATCYETVRSAMRKVSELAGDRTLLAGGRSFGGRMTSMAVAEEWIPGLTGIVFYAFPLHPAKKPATDRGDHLSDVGVPMLFLTGTRDMLAELELLEPIVDQLPLSRLHVIDTADHSFKVLKRSGLTEEQVQQDAAVVVKDWVSSL